jgi:peptidoglycan hydrolase-like protein with peptidoglycan-binding domain
VRVVNHIPGWLVLLAVVSVAAPLHASSVGKAKHKVAASHGSKKVSAKTSVRKTSSNAASAKTGSSKRLKRTRHSRNWKRHGQQAVDARRTEQIQQALIQSHYLDGEPTGAWDSQTQEALRRFQAANGWQSKVVPDSRALIKLGLGPSTDKLLNPESAMTSHVEATPAVPSALPATSGPSTQ